MKRLVLLGEGHGEVSALPILVRKLLGSREASQAMALDGDVVRTHNPSGLVKWNKQKEKPDFQNWIHYLQIAGRRAKGGAVLAVYDGDAPAFPAGARSPFCATSAARTMATAAAQAGAGKVFSLAIVFACVEYETWLIAGARSLTGKSFSDGRPILPVNTRLPEGPPETHGKRWLEKNLIGYRPARDQAPLTEIVDLGAVRSSNLRSFVRLEHALDQLLEAAGKGEHISTPS